jgi:hypothetical protein
MYGHATQEEWTQVLACEACNNGTNSQLEMKGLKSFLEQHPGIKDLLITNLELDVRTNLLLIFKLIKSLFLNGSSRLIKPRNVFKCIFN